MMKPSIEMQNETDGDIYLFIADYHALTTRPAPDVLRQKTLEVAADFIACGLDSDRTVFFRHSDVPEVTELAWILSCSTPMGLLERCHSYKDKISRGIKATHGLFAYPVLMASDILIYQSDTVPVGKDQKQHVEVARDIAQRFNNRYGEIFTLPSERIKNDVAVIVGTDGQKMSKSYGNIIEIFAPAKQIRKKIMGIVTDSKPLEEPKDPDTCPVFSLYSLFASDEEKQVMDSSYRAGNYGYGHAKKELFEKFNSYFQPFRQKREELLANPGEIESILAAGAARARKTAGETLEKARKAVGLDGSA